MKRPAVLFVCLGNICRSPLAEAAFRQVCDRSGFDADIDSAGTGNWHIGDAPDMRAQAVARKNGVDISAYRARQICTKDFQRFDHILAMDHANLRDIRSLQPADSVAQVRLLLADQRRGVGKEVADPYYGGADGFEITWSAVASGANALLDALSKRKSV